METVAMEIHVPRWVKEERGEVDIVRSLLFEAATKMEYYRSRMLAFEKKYRMSYERFGEKIKKAEDEDFEEWDDLVVWEGFHQAYCEW
ncbi:MAG: hypothetical protein KKD21_15790, partial [Proteobacteria bacterium]|nr:hypothetical protein [Pseudomonadota bacterium]